MGNRTSYAPGAFCWVDAATTDAAAAKSFYTGLFGWEMEDNDAGDGAVYTTCRIGGDAVCGLYEMSEEMRSTGAPPNWTSYVSVDSADAAVARAKELGGGAIDGAFDVLDIGRMAVLKDPQGAVFAVWQPRARIGAERVNDVGCLCMNELATTDIEAARSFYEGLFGWTTETVDAGPEGPLALAHNGETLNASFFAVRDGAPAHWRPVFTVESTETAVERVCELGGKQLLEPLELPDGSIAMVLDPQGVLFALFAGDTDP
jgi:predicted enzyme related to lactoylglutathione lyase